MSYLSYFALAPAQIAGGVAVLCVFLVMAILGAVPFGARRIAEADVFTGWGVAVLAFVLIGALGKVALSAVGIGIAAAAFAGFGWRWGSDRRFGAEIAKWPVLWRVLVIGAPLVVLAAAMRISQWDEFSQWLPNAMYLLRFDSFPRADLPVSPSRFPAYPHGLALIVFGASRLAGRVVEAAGGMANVLLLLLLAPAYLSVVRRGLGAGDAWARGWRAAAFGLLGATVLGGTFVQKLVFTHYSDAPTAAVLALLGYLLWRLLNRLAGDEDGGTASAAWQAGLVLSAFLFLKQTNLVLAVLLLGGVGVVVLRDPSIRIAEFLRLLPALLVPGAIVYLGWRYHVVHNIDAGEFELLPRESWLVDQSFVILARMAEIASKKAAYFGIMAVISALGIRSLLRFHGALSRFTIMVGVVFVGYVVFLWAMYIVAFGSYEGPRAASFWRYNTQLGLLGAMAAAYCGATWWRIYIKPKAWSVRAARALGVWVLAATVVAPMASAEKLRFDVRPQKTHLRAVGAEMGRILPKGSRIGVLDPRGDGIAAMIVRFELGSGRGAGRDLDVVGNLSLFAGPPDATRAATFAANPEYTHLLVHEALPEIEAALGVELTADAVNLLERTGAGWRLVKAWPYPGYTEPYRLPD